MNRTVLVIEDTETCAATLEVALAEIPEVEVSLASTVREALRILNREHPSVDAVVTDLNLPFIDGFELIRILRADPRHARVPIVVTSADPDPGAPGRALALGADAYFAKPYSPALVRQAVEQLLNANQCSKP
ncbi:MAG TPA: response regulator [Bryobacteraceae bacterium]